MDQEECCGTCEFHVPDANGDFVCNNPDSDCYSDWTEYGDCCEEWEAR